MQASGLPRRNRRMVNSRVRDVHFDVILTIFKQETLPKSPRETLIKLSFSTANAATVSADEAEDTGDDEWL